MVGYILYPVRDWVHLTILQGRLHSQGRLAFIELTILHVLLINRPVSMN